MIATEAALLLVDGREARAAGGETFDTFNPSTGEKIADVARGTEADIDAAVVAARHAFEGEWSKTTPRERATILNRVAALLREHAGELDRLGSVNGGLPIAAVRNDIEVSAKYCEYYAGCVDKVGGDSIPLGPGYVDYTVREPWGVCGAIVPFNSPYQLAIRSIAPALGTGNTMVIKASEQAPLPTLRLGRLLHEAGVPAGVVNVVPGFGHDAGARLAAHPDVDHLTFTGSPGTAQRVLAGAATQLTPTLVELGGKSPQIVFADADLDEAARTIVSTLVWSCGQACSAGTRVIVERSVHAELAEAIAEHIGKVRVGDAAEGPDMGPLITKRQQDAVLGAIDAGRSSDARLLIGGGVPESTAPGGFFVEPTVFDGVDPGSALAQDEIFGPVLAISEFSTTDEALAFGNWSDFGLIAGVWTKDIDRAFCLAAGLKVGQVYVNNYGVGGGVELPFGGYKKSGFGREKGIAGFLAYTQLKNVCIKVGAS